MSIAESMGIGAQTDTIRAHPTAGKFVSNACVDDLKTKDDKKMDERGPPSNIENSQGDLGLMDGILRVLLEPEDASGDHRNNSNSNDNTGGIIKNDETESVPNDVAVREVPSSPDEFRTRENRRYTLRPGCIRKKSTEVASTPVDDDEGSDDEPSPKANTNRRCKTTTTSVAKKCRKRRGVKKKSTEKSTKSLEFVTSERGGLGGSGGTKPGSKRLGMERLQKCNYCDHSTWQKNVLVQHLAARHKVDLKGNPLPDMKCSQCDFVCVAKYQLNQHVQRKHTLDKPFKCRQCSYAAVFRSDFNKHLQIQHMKKRDFMCEICGFRSQTKGGLNAHVRTHERIKPLKCDTCGAEYSDTLSYRLHVQNHTGNVVNAYVCHVCAHGVRRRSQLRIHLRKKHGIELESGRRKYGSVESSDTTPYIEDGGDGGGGNIEDTSSSVGCVDFHRYQREDIDGLIVTNETLS